MPTQDVAPVSVPPLPYYRDAAERELAASVVRGLAWLGIAVGALGVAAQGTTWALRLGVAGRTSLMFTGHGIEVAAQALQVAAHLILIGSAARCLTLRPGGRTGMLVYAAVAAAAALGLGALGLVQAATGLPNLNAADRAYFAMTAVTHLGLNLVFPATVFVILRARWVRDAFKA